MAESFFRLRINFQKQGVLRFLSHLELVRAMERTIRRAQLPYAISCGFNAHMRHAPGPALPVGTVGLDEYFDVVLTEFIKPAEVLVRLQESSARGLDVIGVSYVDPKAKGLQATHTHETYEVLLETEALSREEVAQALVALIKSGTLTVKRKNKQKTYDLTQAVEAIPEVRETEEGFLSIELHLQSSAQGSIRPELLLTTALTTTSDRTSSFILRSITRTKLLED